MSPRVRALRLPLVVLLVLGVAGTAGAHNRSQGKSRFDVHADGRVGVLLEFNNEDLLDLVDVDLSSPREAKEARAGLMMGRLSTRVPRWLKLIADERECPLAVTGWDDPYPRAIHVQAEARCGSQPDELTIHWGLSKATDLDLTSVTMITAPGDIKHAVVFSRGRTKVTVDVKRPSALLTFGQFLRSGVEHIVTGWDHLAFLLALVLGCATLRRLLLIATGFTLAHSVTLALGALNVVMVPGSIVEPIIAASIAVAAMLGVARLRRGTLSYPGSEGRQRRALVELSLVIGFGLVHGLGFAAMLQDALEDAGTVALPLVAFNLGVEVGQVVAVALAFPLLLRAGRSAWGERVVGALLYGLVGLGVWVAVARVLGG
jgi:hypothetical protein